jgi:hypothetical protein
VREAVAGGSGGMGSGMAVTRGKTRRSIPGVTALWIVRKILNKNT